jgi:hypothetical protein
MGPIFAFLIVVLTGFVLGICVIGAIWEGVRVNKSFKELEQQLRRLAASIETRKEGRQSAALVVTVQCIFQYHKVVIASISGLTAFRCSLGYRESTWCFVCRT